MKQEAPIGRADVRVAALPARAAYLVRAGDRQGVVVAVREASTRWAGVTEPIVPVRANGRIDRCWAQVVELSNVDGLVNVDVPSALADSAAARLGLPVVDIDKEAPRSTSIGKAGRSSRSTPNSLLRATIWATTILGCSPRRMRACGNELQQVTTTHIVSTNYPRSRLCDRPRQTLSTNSVKRSFEVAHGWTRGFANSQSTERSELLSLHRWFSG